MALNYAQLQQLRGALAFELSKELPSQPKNIEVLDLVERRLSNVLAIINVAVQVIPPGTPFDPQAVIADIIQTINPPLE